MNSCVYAIATMDTKGAELAFVADVLRAAGTQVKMVDVGTLAAPLIQPDVSRMEVLAAGETASTTSDTSDRGRAINLMADALRNFLTAEVKAGRISGVIGLGGSGGTSLITTAMRALPIGLPKLMVSTVASGDVGLYIDCSDITMMYSVVDVAGLNAISEVVLANASHAMAGMVQHTRRAGSTRPTLGMTMFGVTTPVSIMPEGLLKNFNPEQTRDLLTYLLTPGPTMPRENIGVPRPVSRSITEVNAILADAPEPPSDWRPLRIVLVAGPKDHGPDEHDYPAWLKAWSELLSIGQNVEIVTAMEWPDPAEFERADVIVFYQRGQWNAQRAAAVDGFLERDGGLVYVHYAVDGQRDAPGFAKRISLAWGNGARFRHGPLTLHFNHDPDHPVSRGFTTLRLVDESYWNLTGELADNRVLGWANE